METKEDYEGGFKSNRTEPFEMETVFARAHD